MELSYNCGTIPQLDKSMLANKKPNTRNWLSLFELLASGDHLGPQTLYTITNTLS